MRRHFGVFTGYTIDLGFLLHGHGKHASKIYLPPLVLGIPELEKFTGLGFHVAPGYSSFGVYVVVFFGFKWTLIEIFGIFWVVAAPLYLNNQH